MTDDKPTLWVTFQTDGAFPTDKEMDKAATVLNEQFADDYNTLLTTDHLDTIDATEAERLVEELINSLQRGSE